MKKSLALFDLETVQNAYEQAGDQAERCIQKLDCEATIIFLCGQPRTRQALVWLEAKNLHHFTRVFREDLVKNRFFSFLLRFTPSNWKQYFLRSLLESIDAGKYPQARLLLFVDRDQDNRRAVSALNDPRILVCSSLEEAADQDLVSFQNTD